LIRETDQNGSPSAKTLSGRLEAAAVIMWYAATSRGGAVNPSQT
jgi:hypothetical protein